MEDSDFGVRDKRGEWVPDKLWNYPPVFVWPVQPVKFLKWFFGYPGYLFPWTALYFLVALLSWLYLTPSMETMENLALGWTGFLLFRNTIIVLAYYGYWHLHLYVQRKQGGNFKYNSKWPENDNSKFMFRSQNLDNIFLTIVFGVPIWTAYEVIFLWAAANNYLQIISFDSSPLYFIVLLLLVPLWQNLHFYLIHRAIHWPPAYKWVHRIHHKNINPGPWSGLAMHPVELLLYFSGPIVLLVLPFHPLHAVFILMLTGLAPAKGHAGFEKIVLGENSAIDVDKFAHYLHHKYYNCNYADGVIPLDKWFGTYHDGSPESLKSLQQRLNKRAAKSKAKS